MLNSKQGLTNRTKKHIIWKNAVKCENLAVFILALPFGGVFYCLLSDQ
nr:MAG TPA: hypothetical protein [Caudoviricetes sp.]